MIRFVGSRTCNSLVFLPTLLLGVALGFAATGGENHGSNSQAAEGLILEQIRAKSIYSLSKHDIETLTSIYRQGSENRNFVYKTVADALDPEGLSVNMRGALQVPPSPETKIVGLRLTMPNTHAKVSATNQVIVEGTQANSPAQKAGVQRNDILKAINGTPAESLNSLAAVVQVIANAPDDVVLDLDRQGKRLQIKTTKAIVPKAFVTSETNKEYLYIKIDEFRQDAATRVKAFLDAQPIKAVLETKLVFDIRGNGGGDLNEVTEVAGMFARKGQALLRYAHRLTDLSKQMATYAEETGRYHKARVFVIIDDSSFAGSLYFAHLIQQMGGTIVSKVQTPHESSVYLSDYINLPDGDVISVKSGVVLNLATGKKFTSSDLSAKAEAPKNLPPSLRTLLEDP